MEENKGLTEAQLLRAMLYELCLALKQHMRLRWFAMLLFPLVKQWEEDWAAWKTALTIKEVEEQAASIQQQWTTEENKKTAENLADQAAEMFPSAIVTPLPDAIVPSVLIETPPPEDASDDVKLLGGEMRITYKLSE